MLMNNKKPLVSVVIPTYNRAHLIGRAIQSVLNQTYQDFEIIVVDDCSTDNTEEIVKSFDDERIRYIRHKKNKGGSAARNTGIKLANGKYIGFLDDDDEWLPQKLEKQLHKFQKSSENVGVIYSGFFFVSEKSGKIVSEVIPLFRGNIYTTLLKSCVIGSPTPLIKRRCFLKAGFFDETLPSCQDWDMWIRLSKYCHFDFVPDILAKHYIHGVQISTDLSVKIVAREKLIEKYWIDLCKNPRVLSGHLKQLGVLYSLAGDQKKGQKYFLRAIKQNPLQKGSYIHFLLSLLPSRIHRNLLKKYYYYRANIDGIILYN